MDTSSEHNGGPRQSADDTGEPFYPRKPLDLLGRLRQELPDHLLGLLLRQTLSSALLVRAAWEEVGRHGGENDGRFEFS